MVYEIGKCNKRSRELCSKEIRNLHELDISGEISDATVLTYSLTDYKRHENEAVKLPLLMMSQ